MFFLNDKKKYKIKNIIILIFIPFLIYFSINNHINKKITLYEEKKINKRIFETHTSGRLDIWNYSIKKHNYKEIFGYGSQGDRYFLKNYPKKDNFGDNTSNTIIYTILSGGIVSLIALLLFYYESIKLVLNTKARNTLEKNFLYINLSLTFIIFFLIRSIFENSFGLFSIDFLITFLSVMCITNSNKISNKNEKY